MDLTDALFFRVAVVALALIFYTKWIRKLIRQAYDRIIREEIGMVMEEIGKIKRDIDALQKWKIDVDTSITNMSRALEDFERRIVLLEKKLEAAAVQLGKGSEGKPEKKAEERMFGQK